MCVVAHCCVGSGLGRMEVIVFLRKRLAGMLEIRLDPALKVTIKGGKVRACKPMPLVW